MSADRDPMGDAAFLRTGAGRIINRSRAVLIAAVAGILLAFQGLGMTQPQPTRAAEQHRQAATLIQKGQLREAVTRLQGALREDPNHIDSQIDLAWIRATATEDGLRDPKEALALGEQMIRTIVQAYNNRFAAGRRDIINPWARLPRSPGYYKVHVFSVMAAAHAAAGRFRAEGVAREPVGTADMGKLAAFNSASPNAVGFGELAAEQAAHEARARPTRETRQMASRTREYLAQYRKEAPLRGVPKP